MKNKKCSYCNGTGRKIVKSKQGMSIKIMGFILSDNTVPPNVKCPKCFGKGIR